MATEQTLATGAQSPQTEGYRSRGDCVSAVDASVRSVRMNRLQIILAVEES
jgi:hypothetical protein